MILKQTQIDTGKKKTGKRKLALAETFAVVGNSPRPRVWWEHFLRKKLKICTEEKLVLMRILVKWKQNMEQPNCAAPKI